MSSNGRRVPLMTVETITPQIAGTMLGTMAGNRPLRRAAIRRYAREMIAGKWLLNGEAVKIGKNGRLIDGEHRMNAVIMANVSVEMLVVRGVDEKARVTLDTGIGRTYYDAGVIRGEDSHRLTGPIARWWYRYERGSPSQAWVATHQELDELVSRHTSIPRSAALVNKLKAVRTKCLPAVQGFVHSYATEKWDGDVADIFMHSLNDGTALKKTDPIWHLRKRLVEDEERLEGSIVLALSIRVWNAWIAGDEMSLLKRPVLTGDRAETFPRFARDVVPQSVANRAAGIEKTRATTGTPEYREAHSKRIRAGLKSRQSSPVVAR